MKKTFTHRRCVVRPEIMPRPVLAGCNDGKNRYLQEVWKIEFPDGTWCRAGTKKEATRYIDYYLKFVTN